MLLATLNLQCMGVSPDLQASWASLLPFLPDHAAAAAAVVLLLLLLLHRVPVVLLAISSLQCVVVCLTSMHRGRPCCPS